MITEEEVASRISEFLQLNIAELIAIVSQPSSTALDICCAQTIMKTMNSGTARDVSTLLDRVIGRPIDKIKVESVDNLSLDELKAKVKEIVK